MSKPTTLYDKIWNDHLVHEADDGTCLLYIDRHLVHEVTSPQAFEGLRATGRKVHAPEKTLAVVDHNVPTTDRSKPNPDPESIEQIETLAHNASEFGIEYYNEFDKRQGIVHVIGPEQGFTLPGTTIVCGDSHTSTHGAFGALAHGIGTSEVEHVLATQTLIQKKAKNMRAVVDGKLPDGVTGKDIILAIIGEIGTAGGTGYVLEYAGEAIRALSMEGRMTVCNMSIEGGARAGLVAPDEKAFEFLKGRPKAPKGANWDAAMRYWETLRSDEGAHFDHEIRLDAAKLPPIVTWGTSPEDVVSISGVVPDPDEIADEAQAAVEAPRAELHGPEGGNENHRHQARPRLHRVLHQRPDRGSARGGEDRRGQDRQRPCQRDGGAGLGHREGAGGSRGAGQDLHQGRLRMARAGLLDVPRDEPRQAQARRALRLDLEPQFRRPPGLQGPHPSGLADHGGGRGHRRAFRRYPGVAVTPFCSTSRRSRSNSLRSCGQSDSARVLRPARDRAMSDKSELVDMISEATRQARRRAVRRATAPVIKETSRLSHWPPDNWEQWRLETLTPWKIRSWKFKNWDRGLALTRRHIRQTHPHHQGP